MELFKIFGTIAVNGAETAEQKIKNLSDTAKDGTERMKKGFTNIGHGAKVVATTTTAAFAAVGGAIVAATEGTREYRVAMGKVQTAFESVGSSAEVGKRTYQDFYAVVGDQDRATEAVSNLAALTTNQRALGEWTTIATGVYAKFGDALPIENLTEAANETAKTGQLTGGLADALNWAGVNEAEFQKKLDACKTAQEREALIRETLNGLYGEAAERYRETNADIIAANEAQARFTDAMALFGAKAEPILTAVKNGFADIIERAAAFLTEVDMEAITASINGAFSWFIETAIPAIVSGVQWIIENGEIITAVVIAVGTAFLTWNIAQIIIGAVQTLTAFKNALALVKAGQLAVNAAMKANVIGVIVTLVAALVAAFIYLWNNCEGFRNFFLQMWEQIKTAFAAVVEWFASAAASISQAFSNAWNSIKGAWSAATGWFSGVWNGIKGAFSSTGSWFGSTFSSAWESIKSAWGSVTSWFGNIWETIKGFFSGTVPIPKIKLPRFSISPSGWKIGDLLDGVIPKLSIAWNARGGVFDKPTVMQGVGEDGAEAVVPLEKNLGWLDKLSGMLCERIIPGGESGTANYTSKLDTMQQTLSALLDKLDGMQLVLDTGAVVGGIAPAMDVELGNIRIRKGRAR